MTNKTTEALKLAELVEASAEEYMGEDGMVMVIPLDLYNDLIGALAAIREVRAGQDHIANASKAAVLSEREWVELTDYEIVRLYAESPMCDSEMIAFARAVIAADREKNK